MIDTQILPPGATPPALDDGEEQNSLPSGEDMAAQALGQSTGTSDTEDTTDDETQASDQLAQTLTSLQNVIERNAEELSRIAEELKHKKESLGNIFSNDTQLSEAEEQAKVLSTQAKERKAKLQADPQVTTLKVQIGELTEQRKEIEETLSNHLVNYYDFTKSTSFDTSDGDQWEFTIRAKVKPRKKG